MTLAFTGLILKFISRDLTLIIEIIGFIQTILVIIYILSIPESPRWLFSKKRDNEGIKILNQISIINCSEKLIP
jgi:hypothetical protein